MKKLYTFLLLIASFAFIATSCKEETKHEPGEPDVEGCYGVYFPEQEYNYKVASNAPDKVVSIKVKRTNTSGTINVPFTFTETTNTVKASELNFVDGQAEAEILLSFPKAEIDIKYKCNIVLPNDPKIVSIYCSSSEINVTIVVEEQWELVGKGQYFDNLLYYDPNNKDLQIQEVEIYKLNDKWRIIDPFANREAAQSGMFVSQFGPDAMTNNYSELWEFYELGDGLIKWDQDVRPGLKWLDPEGDIIYRYPSSYDPDQAQYDEDNCWAIPDEVIQFEYIVEIENVGSLKGTFNSYLGMPGFDLASVLQ